MFQTTNQMVRVTLLDSAAGFSTKAAELLLPLQKETLVHLIVASKGLPCFQNHPDIDFIDVYLSYISVYIDIYYSI